MHNNRMPRPPFTTFSKPNRRLIYLLAASHLLWSGSIYGLWLIVKGNGVALQLWSGGIIALQLYAAAQLLLPALLLHPEERTRSFYIFWAATLALSIWLINQLSVTNNWLPLLTAIKSGLLLLIATLVGASLARYIRRLWEIVPICIVMTLADFASWSHGPTAAFTRDLKQYYLAPEGPPPLIDMVLIKLAFPGSSSLAPVFGISDWIMVVFFATVAHRHDINDNLLGPPGEILAHKWRIGRYLPLSVVALFATVILAQATGLFIPALPLIALIMLCWYGSHCLIKRR